MTLNIKLTPYYNMTITGNAAEGFKLLSVFADAGVNLLAFKAVPAGPNQTRFTLFPDKPKKMEKGAEKAAIKMDGPFSAIIVKSDSDEPGECGMVHEKLAPSRCKRKRVQWVGGYQGQLRYNLLHRGRRQRKSLGCFTELAQ